MTYLKRIALVLAAALVLVACGSGSNDDGTKAPDLPATTAGEDAAGTSTTSTTEAPSTTLASTTTTTAVSAEDVGSREAPVALNEYAELGDWFVRVVSVNPDAADDLLASNDFLEPPAAGNVYFLIELEGVFRGDSSESMWNAFFFNTVGASNVEYDEFDADCGFIDGSLSSQGEAFPGGTVAGFECFEVSAADADTLTLYLEGVFEFNGEDRVFFAVHDGIGSATGVTPTADAGGQSGTDVGSRDNPVAIGSTARVGDWYVQINAVDLAATDRVLAANQFNERPPAGQSYVLADVEATYVGDGSSSFWIDIDWSGVGPNNVAVDVFESSCGAIGGPLDGGMQFFTNGSAEGPLCLAVADDQIDEFVLFFDVFGEERQFFAIHPGAGSPTTVQVEEVPVDLGAAPGSRGNEITFGTEARVADWDVAVVGFNPDAVEAVLAESQFNNEPADGNVFVLIDLEATYRGDGSSTLWADTSWSLLLPSNIAVSTFDVSCGSVPDDLSFADEAFEGGTIAGSICFEVAAEMADELSLIIEDFSTFDGEGTLFFDLS